MVREPKKTFALRDHTGSHFRFHINHYKEFCRSLDTHGVPESMREVITLPVPEPVKVELKILPHWQDKEKQKPAIAFIKNREARSQFIDLPPGSGKAQPLTANIKVPGGWAKMGDMRIGTKVITPKGTTTEVTGVYPQGTVDIYRITFADGRETECCGDHLWKVHSKYEETSYWKIKTVKEILQSYSWKEKRVYVPLIEAEDGPALPLPIDPYVLGVILGDGCISQQTAVVISNPDEFIARKVAERLDGDVKIGNLNAEIEYNIVKTEPTSKGRNSLLEKLRSMNLMGTVSHTKFVPDEYLLGSRQQRLDLLNGLLDTDGHAGIGGTASFTTTSLNLAETVQYLVWSLGGIASFTPKTKYYTYKGEKKMGKPAIQVNIRYPKPSELFTLPRKKERMNDDNQYAANLKLRIEKIEYIGKKEAQCISVADEEHLYVTDRFIVTHNTYCAFRGMEYYGYRVGIVIRPQYLDRWITGIRETFEVTDDDIMVVQGSDSLIALTQLQAMGQLDAKFIIFSNKTLQNWFKLYLKFGKAVEDMGYACTPANMFEFLGIGYRVIDEVHQDFHFNFLMDLYTHCQKSVSLSGTFKMADDDHVRQMMGVAYPVDTIYVDSNYVRYIDVRAWFYTFREIRKLRTSYPGSTTYSHNAFEESIMKHPKIMDGYMHFIKFLIDQSYIKNYKQGNKLLVFGATIEFCTKLTAFLTEKYPQFSVKRYVGGDPDENLINPDIRVSTLGSAGTAVDIPNLQTTLLTVAIGSTVTNVQGLGRTREMKDGQNPQFVWMACQDVPQHMRYHEKRREMIQDRIRSYDSRYYGNPIG